jgi:AraC family transcriptional regulator
VLFLDPAVLADAALRVTGLDAPDLIPQLFIHDPLIAQLVSSFEEEVVAGGIAPRLYIESLASALGAHIVTKYSAPSLWDKRPGALNCSQVRSAVALMNERLDGDITLQDLASSACMSKYHFAKCFKLAVGVAPHQYLVRLRMEKARKLLSGDRLSIEEVANAVGYACRAHFVQQFRKTVGVTPSHYRRAR